MPSALINVPAKAKRGDVIEIKTLMSHIMETGYRHTASGEAIARDIITSFACRYNGNEVFRADLFPAIAGNRSARKISDPLKRHVKLVMMSRGTSSPDAIWR